MLPLNRTCYSHERYGLLSSVDINFRLYFGFEFHETRMYTACLRKQDRILAPRENFC